MSLPALLRRPEVERLTGLSRARIYEKMATGEFPKPVKTGPRAVAWLETEIADWQNQRIAERDGDDQMEWAKPILEIAPHTDK